MLGPSAALPGYKWIAYCIDVCRCSAACRGSVAPRCLLTVVWMHDARLAGTVVLVGLEGDIFIIRAESGP